MIHKYLSYIFTLVVVTLCCVEVSAQSAFRSEKSVIRGGMLVRAEAQTEPTFSQADSLAIDSLLLGLDSLAVDSLLLGLDSLAIDSLKGVFLSRADSLRAEMPLKRDSLAEGAMPPPQEDMDMSHDLLSHRAQNVDSVKVKREGRFFSDSVSLSKMSWTSLFVPGYGQIYNKQYWKLPILYGAVGLSVGLFVNENKTYKPLKEAYDEMTLTNTDRYDELDQTHADMIRSNTRRQIYLGSAIASYIYFMGDAAINYSTNDVSDIKKATTLATICPGAGQIYNKSYWKVPFVVGGFATMIYVIDWNSRGYTRFTKAYKLREAYDNDPDSYPDGSPDEFDGRYSADYLKSLRDSYRRNRDLCYIMTAGMYVLQIIDAHVDAHLKDYDISDDLTMNIFPSLGTTYSPSAGRQCATYGFNFNMTF